MADDLLPDDEVHARDNQTKLDDIWWGIRSITGAGRAILRQGIARLGPDWRPLDGQHTTLETEIGALPQNFAVVRGEIAGLQEQLRQMAVATGAVIDYDLIASKAAQKTADELAARLKGGTK